MFNAYIGGAPGRVITGETRLVGLIGNPVAASLSPRMQNAAFAARGLDWAYVPLQVEPDELEDALRGLVAFGFAGANVTAPYKLDVARLVGADEPSVNTLVVREGGSRRARRTRPCWTDGASNGRSCWGTEARRRPSAAALPGRTAVLAPWRLAAGRVGRRPGGQRDLRA